MVGSTNNNNGDEERRRRRLEEEEMEQMLLAQDEESDIDIDGPSGATSASSGFDHAVGEEEDIREDTPLLQDEIHPQDGEDIVDTDVDADNYANNGIDEFVDEPGEEDQPFPPIPQHQQQQENFVRGVGGGGVFLFSRVSYVRVSLWAAIATMWYAMRTREQFYLACVYLQSSKWAYVVFGNCLVALSISLFNFMTRFFLNGLRLPEAEGLGDYFRWNVTETCLALTMFRSELTVRTGILFLILVVAKCLHWVAEMREGHLRMTEEAIVSNTNPDGSLGWPLLQWPHVRLFSFLSVLQLLDMMAVIQCGSDIMTRGPSVSILFGFEAAILLTSSMSSLLLWHLHVMDGMMHYLHEVTAPPATPQTENPEEDDLGDLQEGTDEAPETDMHTPLVASDTTMVQPQRSWIQRSIHGLIHPWKDHKATLIFAVEVQAQAAKFVFYITFFAIVLTYYGMPINLFREVYMSFQSLRQRLVAFGKYRHLMASMNRFSAPSNEELDDAGPTCIICRDEMSTRTAKKLPGCGHIFHKSCLREWLVQQQTCPTCRGDISTLELKQRQQTAAQEREQQQQNEQEEEQQQQEERKQESVQAQQQQADPDHTEEQTAKTVVGDPGHISEDTSNGQSEPVQQQKVSRSTLFQPDNVPADNAIDLSKNESSELLFPLNHNQPKPPRTLAYPSSDTQSGTASKKALRFATEDDTDGNDKKPAAQNTTEAKNAVVSFAAPSAFATTRPETPPHKKKHVRITTPSAEGQVLRPNEFSSKDEDDYPVFPAFYRVIQDDGAPVWNDGESVSFVIRRVPYGLVILAFELKWRQCSSVDDHGGNGFEDATSVAATSAAAGEGGTKVETVADNDDDYGDDHRLMLRMPDGWVRETDVERIHAVPL